jgi:hypothetical protein
MDRENICLTVSMCAVVGIKLKEEKEPTVKKRN